MVQIIYPDLGFIPLEIMVIVIPVAIFFIVSIFLSHSLKSKKEVLKHRINSKINKESKSLPKEEPLDIYQMDKRYLYKKYLESPDILDRFYISDLEKVDKNLDLFKMFYEKRIGFNEMESVKDTNQDIHQK